MPLSPYERAVLRDARAVLRNPYRTPVAALTHLADERTRRAGDAPPSLDGATGRESAGPGSGLAAAMETGLELAGEVAAISLRGEGVVAAFRRNGVTRVRTLADVARLPLWEVDEVADRVRLKYVVASALLGLGLSAPSRGARAVRWVAAPAVVALCLRVVQELALHYGFDLRDSEERAFATRVLITSLVPKASVDTASPADLGRVIERVRLGLRRVKKRGFGVPLALQLGLRLVRQRAAFRGLRRLLSVGLTAANVWLVVGVMETAQSAYRRRFLARARASNDEASARENEGEGDGDDERAPPAAAARAVAAGPLGA